MKTLPFHITVDENLEPGELYLVALESDGFGGLRVRDYVKAINIGGTTDVDRNVWEEDTKNFQFIRRDRVTGETVANIRLHPGGWKWIVQIHDEVLPFKTGLVEDVKAEVDHILELLALKDTTWRNDAGYELAVTAVCWKDMSFGRSLEAAAAIESADGQHGIFVGTAQQLWETLRNKDYKRVDKET